MPAVAAWPICSSAETGFGWLALAPVLAPTLVVALVFVAGYVSLPKAERRSVHAVSFLAGLLFLTAALVPPISILSDQLFAAHMIEHEIVLAVASPLLALSRPSRSLLAGLPRFFANLFPSARSATASVSLASSPGTAAAAHGAAIWLLHVPIIFDAAIGRPLVHHLLHLVFLVTALVFWKAMFRADRGVAAGCLFLTMLHTSMLGALIALSPRILYPLQTARAPQWGLTALEDQQLAGLLMWIPAGIAYAALALYLAACWIKESREGSWRAPV